MPTRSIRVAGGGTQILGDSYLSFTSDEQTLDTLPYPELWKGFLAAHPLKDEDLLGIYLMLIVFEDNYHTEIVDLNADNYPFKGLKNVESWKYDYHFKLIIATLLADLKQEKSVPTIPSSLRDTCADILLLSD